MTHALGGRKCAPRVRSHTGVDDTQRVLRTQQRHHNQRRRGQRMRTDTRAETYERPTSTWRDAHGRQSARKPHINPRSRHRCPRTRVGVCHPRRGHSATSFTAGGHGSRSHRQLPSIPRDPARPVPAAHPRERSRVHETPLGAC